MTALTIEVLTNIFEQALQAVIRLDIAPIEIVSPMVYSLNSGGKRVRPLLLLWILGIQSPDYIKKGLRSAIAVEFIHTYSLIHDDLPAMDNDDMRRGKPTNHKKFDEGTAILAGDALLTDAFYLITQDDLLTDDKKVEIIRLLSQAAGSSGMIAGQMKDIHSKADQMTLETVERMHELKTGQLFLYCVQAAAVIAGLDSLEYSALEQFAKLFGKAFQIHNDLKDVVGTVENAGRAMHSDQKHQKATYPQLLGVEESMIRLNDDLTQARQILSTLEQTTHKPYTSLSVFLDYLVVEMA